MSHIEVHINADNSVTYTAVGGYESRVDSVITMFNLAFEQIQMGKIATRHFCISLDDVSSPIGNSLTFGFTRASGVVVCPDYTFIKWPEVGIINYIETINSIAHAGSQPWEVDKMFWIGNPRTQDLRYKLIEIGNKNRNDFMFVPMNWLRNSARGQMHSYTYFVSLADHTKFLVDCGAFGYSGRLKFLLFSGRPIFLVERTEDKQDHFYPELRPYAHFIPVKADLSDLVEQYEWARAHEKDVEKIAESALSFAKANLSETAILRYLSDQLKNYLYK